MADAFELAGEQLKEVADASDGTVQLCEGTQLVDTYCLFEISIRFDGLERVQDGLPVRAREAFRVFVPFTFPFEHPLVTTPHVRFSGFNHVQWRRQLCLYRSSADWRPENGMYGFVKRLDAWIRDAAVNNLDPDDAPLHPPVAYPTVNRLFVPKADTPPVADSPWFGFAELRDRSNRTEIVGWREHGQELPAHFAPAILLHRNLPFEYPKSVHSLVQELESHGVDYGPFIRQLALYAQNSGAGTPLAVVLGTPMRRVDPGGPALQHLAVWEIPTADADKLRELNVSSPTGDPAQWAAAVAEVVKWSVLADVGWCRVREMRPEVTRRRDQASPMAWFSGKRVVIWGCGAVGTHVAESVVRAGARTVELVDNKTVAPGLLVRQGFEDADIGRFKAHALADRLKRIDPDLEAVASTGDLIQRVTGADPLPMVDLLLDCTASMAVRTALEHALRDAPDTRPPVASIAIDSQAANGIATLSRGNHSGGTLDLTRCLKLEACRSAQLARPLEAFWPRSAPGEEFQPEPGCSEPTFIGSNADLAGLSARMLNSIARAIQGTDDCHTGFGWTCEESGPVHEFSWPPEHTLRDKGRGYSVRVSATAAREMRAWARRSARTVGPRIETGGLVFGELNEAAGVLWVTEVEGPPPDSDASEKHFTCGVEGMMEAAESKRCRFRGSVDCVGSWHTHPSSSPHPSDIDIDAVAQLLADPVSARRTCLILILSGNPDDPILGAHAFKTTLSGKNFIRIERNTAATTRLGPPLEKPRNVGLALSGGGSRAIAFHLGCLRALHDLDLLDRLQVISSVSGGSVISAMYAYSDDPFPEFEARALQLLDQGLHRDIFRQVFRPSSIRKAVRVHFVASVCFIARMLHRLSQVVNPSSNSDRVSQPVERTFSRTEAFKEVIAESMFGDTIVRDISRKSLDTVINATELRTGSAFRFGSRQSGCWRFGTIAPEDALVADAVAASAAYPVFLPALERKYRFVKNGQTSTPTRVLLTDGGVFENLGVNPMEPGRIASISTNVFDPEYIICCDAGAGLFDDDSYPTRWPTRMYRSFLTVFRKVQDATRKRLHYFADDGKISGFALSYLGQKDSALPWIPADLPTRDEVRHYPTDFAAMPKADVERLALRGEILTRLLVAYYLPEI